jgi:hypothetical protein
MPRGVGYGGKRAPKPKGSRVGVKKTGTKRGSRGKSGIRGRVVSEA